MNPGALLFQQKLPIVVELEGDIDGVQFSVHGKGTGDASTGRIVAKFISTSGDLPCSWASLVSSSAYGMQCFAKYPAEIEDFLKSTFPEGYIQERTINFENDGTYTTRAEVTFENGAIYNRVKLTGKGFNKGGNILGKKLVDSVTPSASCVVSCGNSIKVTYQKVYEVNGGGFQHTSTIQQNTPLGKGPFCMPKYHHLHATTDVSKDPKETADHIVVVETLKAVDCYKY